MLLCDRWYPRLPQTLTEDGTVKMTDNLLNSADRRNRSCFQSLQERAFLSSCRTSVPSARHLLPLPTQKENKALSHEHLSKTAPLVFGAEVKYVICQLSVPTENWTFTCGVVTRMAPSGLCALTFSTTVMCSSDVPGGVSMIR